MTKIHEFEFRQSRAVITTPMPLIFGIGGVARSGKDTMGAFLLKKLTRLRFPCLKVSFAHEVKMDLDPFIRHHFNFSAFTERDNEKKLLRPMLVAYAEAMRRNDIMYWIKRAEKRILSAVNNNIIVIITDVRKEVEAKWIKQQGGYLIHLKRIGLKPADFEEKINDPIIKRLADKKLWWRDFKDPDEIPCKFHINKLFLKNKWSPYGKFTNVKRQKDLEKNQCKTSPN